MRLAVFAILCMLLEESASAVPITYIHKGSGTGTVAGVPFASTFTIITEVDTDDIAHYPQFNFHRVDNVESKVVIDTVGSFRMALRTGTFVNQNYSVVGFGAWDFGDLYNGPYSDVFKSWDLSTPIGPIEGQATLLQWSAGDVQTDGGVLRFDDAIVENASFQAVFPSTQLGDTDGDADVDLEDLNNVRNNFGGEGLGDTAPFDSDVDLDDLNAVRNNFGAGGANPVPEPSSLALLALGVAGFVSRRRMGRR